MPLTQSLRNSAKQNDEMQLVVQDKIEVYLERRFRISRSFATRNSYRIVINRFIDFVRIHYNLDFSTLLPQIKKSKRDPIDILDDYYSRLSEEEKPKTSKAYEIAQSGNVAYVICIKTMYYFCTVIETR